MNMYVLRQNCDLVDILHNDKQYSFVDLYIKSGPNTWPQETN